MSTIKCCKECSNRYIGCHGRCAEYIAEQAAHEARLETIRQEKNRQGEYISYKQKRHEKWE